MLFILLPVHNRISITRTFVECLRQQTLTNYHLILIDDGSTDGTSEFVAKEIERCTIIKGDGNLWWGGSLEKGYQWICENVRDLNSVILIINNDVEFEEDFLESGVKLLLPLNRKLVYAKAFSKQTHEIFYSGVHVDWRKLSFEQASTDEEVNCVSTRGLFLKAGDFVSIGGFYPRILPHYISDYEFTIRAYNMGYRFQSDNNLRITMDESTTGYRNLAYGKGFFKRYFSKKNPNNPIYFSVFILLSCPARFKVKCLLKIWKGAVINILRGLTS